ncbi:hypothetical protein [Paraburkholderia largidicola]|jgi:hypothetical protein|uniref:hypothetical protein n=1 Tax=Paraburkholderia largidicola TaxID=3014751 RepID=UPI0015D9A00D|nr:hypothetical protein [Paraburkholderia sp. PGU16]
MIDSIVSSHPFSTLSPDSDLAILLLDLADVTIMSASNLECLIASSPSNEIRAYLHGVRDMRLSIAACLGTPA